jgi:hypothetical protein
VFPFSLVSKIDCFQLNNPTEINLCRDVFSYIGNEQLKRIGVGYVWYYNRKYRTRGHFFQDRVRNENVEKNLLPQFIYMDKKI